MKTAYDIIIKPVITEQSMEATEDKKYVFQVAIDANKVEIKKAVAAGYWQTYRYNPEAEKKFTLDSKDPTESYLDFIKGENKGEDAE